MKKVKVVESVLKANDAIAAENRKRLEAAGVLSLNLMSSPGSGKTTLLQRTLQVLGGEFRCSVLVGDLQTTRDADRMSDFADEVIQINTGRGCHLDAAQVAQGLDGLTLDDGFLFIENVGNMVCPASFDLGEHRRVVLLSTPEGDDKVAKYPTLFAAADVVLLTKIELREVLEFDVGRVRDDLSQLNTRAPLIELSSKTGHNFDAWLRWLRDERAAVTAADQAMTTGGPAGA